MADNQRQIELLPCPFCGGEAAFGTTRYSDSTVKEQAWKQDVFYSVNCIVCAATTKGLAGSLSQTEAANKWNKRTIHQHPHLLTEAK